MAAQTTAQPSVGHSAIPPVQDKLAALPVLQELKCPTCGSPVMLHVAGAQTVVCGRCNSHITLGAEELAASRGSKLPHPRAPVALGQQVTLDGVSYIVLGRVLYRGWDPDDRSDRWEWNEWMLGAQDGRMLWLSLDEHGFRLYNKMRFRTAFDPQNASFIPLGEGKSATITERYPAEIVGAEGELTWQARPRNSLTMVEGQGDGKTYSLQVTPDELELYESTALSNAQILAAFKATNPEAQAEAASLIARRAGPGRVIGWLCLAFAVVGLVIGLVLPGQAKPILTQQVTLDTTNPIAAIPLDFQTVERPILVRMDVTSSISENQFADIDLSVVDPEGEETEVIAEEFWHETGVDEGEFWREQDLNGSGEFVPFLPGMHQIELELGSDPPEQLTRVSSVSLNVTVMTGHFASVFVFVYAGVAGLIGVLLLLRSGGVSFGTMLLVVGIGVVAFILLTSGSPILDLLLEFA